MRRKLIQNGIDKLLDKEQENNLQKLNWFLIKTLNKLEIEANLLILIRDIFEKSTIINLFFLMYRNFELILQ